LMHAQSRLKDEWFCQEKGPHVCERLIVSYRGRVSGGGDFSTDVSKDGNSKEKRLNDRVKISFNIVSSLRPRESEGSFKEGVSLRVTVRVDRE